MILTFCICFILSCWNSFTWPLTILHSIIVPFMLHSQTALFHFKWIDEVHPEHEFKFVSCLLVLPKCLVPARGRGGVYRKNKNLDQSGRGSPWKKQKIIICDQSRPPAQYESFLISSRAILNETLMDKIRKFQPWVRWWASPYLPESSHPNHHTHSGQPGNITIMCQSYRHTSM